MLLASVSDERVSRVGMLVFPGQPVWTFLSSAPILQNTNRYRIAESI